MSTSSTTSFLGLFLFLLLVTSCSSNSPEDFRDEGRRVTRALIVELKTISTHQDFAAHTLKLKKLFYEQVEIIDRLNRWRQVYPEAQRLDLAAIDQQLSQKLKDELSRIYKIEGGRKFLQKCQEEALHFLDASVKNRNGR